MRAGKLQHRVTIAQKSAILDDVGEERTTWTGVAVVWAAIEPVQSRLAETATQAKARGQQRVRIRMRYQPSLVIDSGIHRIEWMDGQGTLHIYDVEEVVHKLTGRRELHLYGNEVLD